METPKISIDFTQDGGKPLNDVIVLRDRSVAERAKQEASSAGFPWGYPQ